MRYSNSIIVLAAAFLSAAAVRLTVAQDSADAPQEIAVLIRQLGADKYDDREKATRGLQEIGAAALPAVEEAMDDPDFEIVQRCRTLLPKLRAADADRRLEEFIAGRGKTLAGWDLFRRLAGEDEEARKFFAELYRVEFQLLEEIERLQRRGHLPQIGSLYHDRVMYLTTSFQAMMQRHQQDQEKIPASFHSSVCAMLLIGSIDGLKPSDMVYQNLSLQLVASSLGMRDLLGRPDVRGKMARDLLGGWCLSATSEQAITNALREAIQHNLEAPSRELARRALALKSQTPQFLGSAAAGLARFGQSEDVPRLLPLLSNQDEALWTGNKLAIEVGDVALTALVRLTGQKIEDYGISDPAQELTLAAVASRGKIVHMTKCPMPGFNEGPQREAAMKKWAEWAAAHPEVIPKSEAAVAEANADPLAPARTAVQSRIAGGRRMRNWMQHIGQRPLDQTFKATIDKDRIALDNITLKGIQAPNDTPFTFAFELDQLGKTVIQTRVHDNQPSVYEVVALAEDAGAGTLTITTFEGRPDFLALGVERVTAEETTRFRYEQRGDVRLKIERVVTKTGKELASEELVAATFTELRQKHAEKLAATLDALLAKLGCELPK